MDAVAIEATGPLQKAAGAYQTVEDGSARIKQVLLPTGGGPRESWLIFRTRILAESVGIGDRLGTSLVPDFRFASRAQQLWATVIAAAAATWQARMEQAAGAAGLSPVAAWALVQLDPNQPLPQKALAARLHRNPSSVVDTMDRLEKAKLVMRSPNREDRRVKVLVVTPKGARVRRKLISQMLEPPETFTTLPAADQIRLRDLMHAALASARAKSGAAAQEAFQCLEQA